MEREHPYRDNWDEDYVVLAIEEDEYTAYCSPNAGGRVFIDGQASREMYENNAPFGMDILFDEVPDEDEAEAIAVDAGEQFNAHFEGDGDGSVVRDEEGNILDEIDELSVDDLMRKVEDDR